MQDLFIDRVHRLIVAAAVLHHPRVLPRSLKRTAPPPQKSEPHQSNQSPQNKSTKSRSQRRGSYRAAAASWRRGGGAREAAGAHGHSKDGHEEGTRGRIPPPAAASAVAPTDAGRGAVLHGSGLRGHQPRRRGSFQKRDLRGLDSNSRRNFRPVFELGQWRSGLGTVWGVGI